MNIEIDPKCVPEGWEAVGFRVAVAGDWYLDSYHHRANYFDDCPTPSSQPRLILRKQPEPVKQCELGPVVVVNGQQHVDYMDANGRGCDLTVNGDVLSCHSTFTPRHITREQAAKLWPVIQRFANTGQIARTAGEEGENRSREFWLNHYDESWPCSHESQAMARSNAGPLCIATTGPHTVPIQ